MGKISSLDLSLLEAMIFGIDQGYPGRYIAGLLVVLNLCCSMTLGYLVIGVGYSVIEDDLSIRNLAKILYLWMSTFRTVIIQIRCLSRRRKSASIRRELSHLNRLSTWTGDIYGCIGRIAIFIGFVTIHRHQPPSERDLKGCRTLTFFLYWLNFVPTAAAEFLGQAMLLLQHEFRSLCRLTEAMVKKRAISGIGNLRALNRRHASLFALSNTVAGFTGMDSLLMIESERFLILLAIFMQVNLILPASVDWRERWLNTGLYIHRIERITHSCFRGYRIVTEADRFVSTLDEIDPLDFHSEENFTEVFSHEIHNCKIFRKQVRLRKLQFDCNRFLKLDMRLIFQITKELLALMIVLVQLTTGQTIRTSKVANGTDAGNVSGYNFPGFSNLYSNSSTPGSN